MTNPVFNKESFTLCEVPVPKGYPQSQTHSGIAFYAGRYYLTTSPYPVVKYSKFVKYFRIGVRKLSHGWLFKPIIGEKYENPCLYVGDVVNSGFPTKFIPMTTHPLMETPERHYGLPAFNSDPDIFIEDGIFLILNRSVFRTRILEKGYESITNIYLIKGIAEGDRFKFMSNHLIKEWDKPYASPCLTKYKSEYVFTYLDTNSGNDGETFNGLYIEKLDDIVDLKKQNVTQKVAVDSSHLLPWHMSLFHHEGKLYTIIACVEKGDKSRKIWQMLGEFNDDLSKLTVFPRPLTDYNSYRGAAYVNDQGIFVLYSTTVHERVRGSQSVDGRDVVMANKPFGELLIEIKKTEI